MALSNCKCSPFNRTLLVSCQFSVAEREEGRWPCGAAGVNDERGEKREEEKRKDNAPTGLG
jgi:hypothetical protein